MPVFEDIKDPNPDWFFGGGTGYYGANNTRSVGMGKWIKDGGYDYLDKPINNIEPRLKLTKKEKERGCKLTHERLSESQLD